MEQDMDFYSALCMASEIPTVGKAAAKIRPFVLFIQSMFLICVSKEGSIPLRSFRLLEMIFFFSFSG